MPIHLSKGQQKFVNDAATDKAEFDSALTRRSGMPVLVSVGQNPSDVALPSLRLFWRRQEQDHDHRGRADFTGELT
ncbi:Uncharacterised protein [Serratia odorifera]|uniref:L,D-transpeptidase C-terminal domain-containing protein n=1 Tax=Serratia odorifera TaxID=618 RepID=A0A3S4F1K5_SEROD|nr:Uncharacterised protein [Serratia odorifera]